MAGFGDAMSRLFGGNPGNSSVAVTPGNPAGAGDPNAKQPGNKPVPQAGESTQLEGAAANIEKQATPLDGYKDLWQSEQSKEQPGAQGNQPVPQNTPPANQPPAFLTAAKGLNFSRNIPQDLMAKAVSGDAAAFAQVLDHVGRQASAASFHYAERHFSQSGKTLREDISKSLPDQFRQFSLQNTSIKNPVLSKPGVKPVVEGIRMQLASKFPDATTEELQQKAEQYFLDLQTELGTHAEASKVADNAETQKHVQTAQANGEFDWDAYYGYKSS